MIGILSLLVVVFLILTLMVFSKTTSVLKRFDGATVDKSPENYQGAPSKNNSLNGIGLLVFWIAMAIFTVWSFIDAKKDFLPVAASDHGEVTDYWFWVSMIVITIGFFVVNTLLFYFSYRYKFDKNRKATFYSHNNTLEVIWTTVPALIMAGLVFTGLKVWNQITDDAPNNAEAIEIMGKQFGWIVRYSGTDGKLGKYNFKLMNDAAGNQLGVDFSDPNSLDDFSNASELHVQKGKPVLLKIRSRDVLHSVYIPHMRVKMDAVPGMPTKFWFTPNKTTAEMRAITGNSKFNYEIACAEVCGRSHFGMKLLLVVDEPEAYQKWKREQKPLLTESPGLMEFVPASLKSRAAKFIPAVEPIAALVATDSVEVK